MSVDQPVGGDSNVAAQAHTGWLTMGAMGNRHRLRRIDLLAGAALSVGDDVTIHAYRDFNSTDIWNTQTEDVLAFDLEAWHMQNQAFDQGEMFTWLRLDIRQSGAANTTGLLMGYQVKFSSRPYQRGQQGGPNQNPVGGGGT